MVEPNPKKPHINIVVIGHVDSGKSTTCGHLLYKLGKVDQRQIEKLNQEAAQNNKDSFGFAYVMDRTKAEQQKGITIDITLKQFETNNYNYTIIDAPGHKDFLKNMITGTAQADVALLMISANEGEFEAGFSKEGSTKEHALLAYTLGVKQMIVAINKMDSKLVNFSGERFENIKNEVSDYLKKIGFDPKKVPFIPISGYQGLNLTEKCEKMDAFYNGPTLKQALDAVIEPKRPVEKPLRIPINGVYKIDGIGTVVTGRVESGVLKPGKKVVFAPSNIELKPAEVKTIEAHKTTLEQAIPGDNIGFNVRGLNVNDVQKGYVCSEAGGNAAKVCQSFVAQIIVTNKKEIKKGYIPVINVHTSQVACEFSELISKNDKRTGQVIEEKPEFLQNGDSAYVLMVPQKPLCVECFADFPALGRFVVREGKNSVAIGIIKKVNYK